MLMMSGISVCGRLRPHSVVMFSTPLRPMAAYRSDLARERPGDSFSDHDCTWLIICSLVDRLAAATLVDRRALLAQHEQMLATAFGPVGVRLPRENLFYWLAEWRRALTTSVTATPDCVISVLRALAAEMAAMGALEIASRLLWTAMRALPNASAQAQVWMLIDLGEIATQTGNLARARGAFSSAAREAKRAGLIDLHYEAQCLRTSTRGSAVGAHRKTRTTPRHTSGKRASTRSRTRRNA